MKPTPVAAVLCLLAVPAGAQSLMPGPATAGRYEMQPIEGGVARLDTVTGEISLCRVEAGVLRCRPSEDGEAPAAVVPPAPGVPQSDAGAPAPADEDAEIDRSIDRMKRFFRAFRDIAREFDGDDGARPVPETPAPNRT